ncbi:MAG: hypothetical protein LUQ65_05050, partial [Candidatus Helarchaeota archaeon]|nr:hypothetical protein [Candidatus Helarchaeota archaeon]
MFYKSFHIRDRKNLLSFSLAFGIVLVISCFLGINSIAPTNVPSPVDQNEVPLAIEDDVTPGNFTRSWEPIILTTANISALTGLSGDKIRVVYYMADQAAWMSVPFQIDEWENRISWQNGVFFNSTSFLNVSQGFIGRDTDGMEFEFNGWDELVFYAHSGAQVSRSMWWEGDSGGRYPVRVEMAIRDPVDGGRSWVYIYLDPFVGHGDPYTNPALGKWITYTPSGWSTTLFRAYGDNYNVSKSKVNPDLEVEIRNRVGASRDPINETMKSYANVSTTFLLTGTKFVVQMNREGIWGGISYSNRKTEIQYPDSGTVDTEGGIGAAIPSGPIRSILNKRIYEKVVLNSSTSFTMVSHQV